MHITSGAHITSHNIYRVYHIACTAHHCIVCTSRVHPPCINILQRMAPRLQLLVVERVVWVVSLAEREQRGAACGRGRHLGELSNGCNAVLPQPRGVATAHLYTRHV